ncbi:MAG: hypothetical protein V7K96_19110 [Nostoc sp.]
MTYRILKSSISQTTGKGKSFDLEVNLQVRVSNAEVVEFYRKLGYLVEERISMRKLVP